MGKYYTDKQLRERVEWYKPVGEPKRPTEGMRTFLRGYAHAVEELTGLPGDNGKMLGEDGNVYLWLHPKTLEISDAISDDIDEKVTAIEFENAELRIEVERLRAENAGLRGLIDTMWNCLWDVVQCDGCIEDNDDEGCVVRVGLRQLGIEVS